jgi:UDP-N-acetylglucosamine acyltransferase
MSKSKLISKRAEIHPGAILGENVIVEAFAKIDRDVVIGDGSRIGANATIYPGARIGAHCSIYPGAVIASEPQDLKFRGEYSRVEIGDHTTVREYASINRGTDSKGVTRVGSHSLLMAYSHLGHDVSVGNHCVISNSVQVAGEVLIEDYAIIGGMSAIHQFCRVGAYAFVSGMTGILSDVAPYTKVFGIPASYMGINTLGLTRRGFSREQMEVISEAYRILYQKGLNTTQALEVMAATLEPSPELEKIISFIKNSRRGVIKTLIRNGGVTHKTV